jgi:anti-sigma-K factor RskA
VTRGWRSLLVWSAAALLAAATAVTFVRWGTNGPAYIVDLVAAYCL